MTGPRDTVDLFGGLVKLSDPSGHSCSCPDVRYAPDPRCPIHGERHDTCRVCAGLNGQHYSQCAEDPWR